MSEGTTYVIFLSPQPLLDLCSRDRNGTITVWYGLVVGFFWKLKPEM